MPKQLQRMKQSETARRVTLAEWRAGRLHDHTLPSGLAVKLRDVTMTDLMLTGRLPAPIFDMVKEATDRGDQEVDLKAFSQNAGDFTAMLNLITELCLVEPHLGEVSDDEHITLGEIPADDKMEIFNWVNREVEAVRSFREGEAEPGAVV